MYVYIAYRLHAQPTRSNVITTKTDDRLHDNFLVLHVSVYAWRDYNIVCARRASHLDTSPRPYLCVRVTNNGVEGVLVKKPWAF